MKDALLAGTEENLHRTIFLRGTSGRGKTSFVYYLMYCILISAKKTKAELESDPHAFVESKKRKAEQESDLLIGYVCDEGSSVAKFLLTLSHVKRVASIPSRVHYYIADTDSDENRTNLAKYFMMVVDSDDSRGKTEFRKRLQEANGETFLIPPPTREQMHLMFAGIHSSDEIDFRLDVVGCKPRLVPMRYSDSFKRNLDFEGVVKDTCAEILGCADTDADPAHFNWVMDVVMQAIETAIEGEKKITVNSLFREDIREDSGLRNFFTSTFMCFLAGKIRDKFATDTLGYLTMLFGPSGVGFCHEYDAHNFFCGLTSASHPCWSFTTKKWMNMPLGNGPRQKVTFRNIKNISGALLMSRDIPQRYLLPNVTNLALIDSIIPMDTVLQMTVSNFHRGATNRMTDIHKELGEPRTVKMIFVVPGHIVSTFIFPTNMPEYVQMFVTVAKVMTLSEARKFRAG
mmetsp:Transcript_30632/g.41933  ORF Transcript_30632/g.41933 Transcript_30632/m.41933 type:complete len:458 (-) Transcript_30632:70-1443(-)